MKTGLFITGLIVGAIIGFGLMKMFNSNITTTAKRSSKTVVTTINKANSAKWQWPDSLDAVKAAPNSHKVLFENDKIRILEVTVEPYGFEPMHTHRYPSLMFGSGNDTSHYDIIYYKYDYDTVKHVYFAKDSIHQHSGGIGTKEHFMKPEGPHRIKNLSNVRILAYRVEFKS